MDNARYPPTSQMYPPNRDSPLQPSHPNFSALPPISQDQTTTTVWDRDTKSYRSLQGARTPSPTPSETAELSRTGVFDWQKLVQWRFWFRREWFWYYVVGIFVCTVATLVTLYHREIVEFLKPAADWMHEFPAGFVIPIAVLFIISFPPLFGHEIVAILCGLFWGLWLGFGIVCAGTFLGEVGNFYAFRHCCRSRGEKLERTNITYGCLAKVVRDGGFTIALIARLSAIPGHFTTAVFSTCGMGIVVFSLAALVSLPKQFITVYLGVALEQAANGEGSSVQEKVLKYGIIGVTLIITMWAMWYVYAQMGRVKAQVIYGRRKARQTKTVSLGNDALSHSTIILTPLPTRGFNPGGTSQGQRWDEPGSAIGLLDSPLGTSKRAVRPAVDEGRDALTQGGDHFDIRNHHNASYSTGPRLHGREALPNPFDPRQHLRTRSLSGFYRDTTIDNLHTSRTVAANR